MKSGSYKQVEDLIPSNIDSSTHTVDIQYSREEAKKIKYNDIVSQIRVFFCN